MKNKKISLKKLITNINEKVIIINKLAINQKTTINNLKGSISTLQPRLKEKFNKLSNNTISNYKQIIDSLEFQRFNPKKKFQNLQNYIEKVSVRDKRDIVLKPSTIWSKYILSSLLATSAFSVAWLAIAKTEEIIIVQGKLEPITNGVVSVQMPLEGIAQEILVEEGEYVEKNQILMKLDTDINKSKQKLLNKNQIINQEIYSKLKLLEEEGAVSKIRLLQQELKLTEIENQIERNEIILSLQEIRSPISGLIFDLQPQQTGFVGRSSEMIMKIVPINELLAKVEIDSSKIGFVSPGKPVDISIDSFPASDFGIISGTLTKIGSDALPPDPSLQKGYRYPAKIKLNSQNLELKNGTKLKLQTGMSLTANIKLRKVSYLQLLLGTFQSKKDSLRSL